MPGDETRQKTHDGSDSESEDEEFVDVVPKIDIDPSKLTPLSPEVISKQVRSAQPVLLPRWTSNNLVSFYIGDD